MTTVVSSNTSASVAQESSSANRRWAMYLYGRDFPVETEVEGKYGDLVKVKVHAGEKVLFNLKKAVETFDRNSPFQTLKFVWMIMNYCSKEEPISHSSAFYRGMSIGSFDPTSGKYKILSTKVDGEKLPSGELSEYANSFIEDCINDAVYDEDRQMKDGAELLLKMPNIFKRGSTAIPTSKLEKVDTNDTTTDLPGFKVTEVAVDGSKVKYSVKKKEDSDMLCVATPEKLIAFSLYDMKLFIDKDGLHTDRPHEGKTFDVRTNNKENYNSFVELYFKEL